ncbi:hypothetical protein EHF33_07285 [Deinococcus psychrotolerans]|uniref:BIG2 domain-containing protein n=1 Tax=Deinococcus psychrotolerans TaxID=2489213 RepID=A0A3G8YLS2_9DEIO|nr:Ig-like domain-containing protein [Deinococcus psychrotolerans]AZI42571.1 hypothetical protein EHF33_07285 [Deinococcus psychrotolerans]
MSKDKFHLSSAGLLLSGFFLLTACQGGGGTLPEPQAAKPSVTAALDQSDQAAPSIKVQASGAVSVQYAVNGNPAQSANLSGNGSIALSGLCPGVNTLIYSVKVGSTEILSNQKSSFTLPDTVYTPTLSAVSLSVGSGSILSVPISEQVALACAPQIKITSADGLPITVKSAAVEGAVGTRVIKAELLANAEGTGKLNVALTWGSSTRSFDWPVSAKAASGTGPIGSTPAPAVTVLKVAPNPVNLLVGASLSLKTDLQGTGNFSSKLNFKIENVDVATVDGSGVVKAVAPGKTTLTVTPIETPAKAVSVPLTVTAAPSFQMLSDPASLSITAGQSANFTLKLQPQNGYAGTATISLPSLPSGISASLSANIITPSAPVKVTLSANGSAPASTNVLLFKATDPDNLNASATLGLQVNVAPSTPGPTPPPAPPSDTTPPVVSNVSPAVGSLILDDSISVKASVNDNSAIANVSLSVNGLLVGQMKADADNTYQMNWDVSKLKSGTYALLIQASDTAGNVGVWQGRVDLSRPGNGLQLLRRFTFDRSPTSNVAFSGAYGFVGASRTLERFDTGSSNVTALPLTNGSIESVEVVGNQVYVSAADNTVTVVDASSLSQLAVVQLPSDRTTTLKTDGQSVFIGTRSGVVMITGTRSSILSSAQVTALAGNPGGGVYAAYVGGQVDVFSASGTLSTQGSSSGLGFLQVAGGQLYGGKGMHLYTLNAAAPLASEMSLSPAPGGTIGGATSISGMTVISDAAGLLTSLRGSQAQLDGAVMGMPAVYGDTMYVPTKNYSLYAVKASGGSLSVVSQTENLGLVVAPTAVDGSGQVYYVSLNGVYVFKP